MIAGVVALADGGGAESFVSIPAASHDGLTSPEPPPPTPQPLLSLMSGQ